MQLTKSLEVALTTQWRYQGQHEWCLAQNERWNSKADFSFVQPNGTIRTVVGKVHVGSWRQGSISRTHTRDLLYYIKSAYNTTTTTTNSDLVLALSRTMLCACVLSRNDAPPLESDKKRLSVITLENVRSTSFPHGIFKAWNKVPEKLVSHSCAAWGMLERSVAWSVLQS